jgi:hypothetical protein
MKTTEQICDNTDKVSKDWIEVKEVFKKLKDLKNFVGNMRFKISNESLQSFYNKVEQIEKEMLK